MPRTRVAAGRHAVAVGKDFEELIRVDLEMMRQQKVVRFFAHTEVAYRRRGREWVPVAPGFADWSGFFRGALQFAAEAKSREGDRFGFNELPQSQVDHLEATASAGGVALLALEFRTEPAAPGLAVPPPRRFAVPWRKVPWRVAVSARAVYADELAGFELVRPFLTPFIWACPVCRVVWPIGRECRCRDLHSSV